MGLGGISIWQLLIILAIVIVLFGTTRLKNIGSDLGSAIKGFKKSMADEPDAKDNSTEQDSLAKTQHTEDEQQEQPAENKDKV